MNDRSCEEEIIHLSELDEFLASRLMDIGSKPFRFSVYNYDSQGNITIRQGKTTDKISEGGIDFELSPSEYYSLDSIDIEDFTKQTVYTSSAYEFFDFILMYFCSLDCVLDFSWRKSGQRYKEIYQQLLK